MKATLNLAILFVFASNIAAAQSEMNNIRQHIRDRVAVLYISNPNDRGITAENYRERGVEVLSINNQSQRFWQDDPNLKVVQQLVKDLMNDDGDEEFQKYVHWILQITDGKIKIHIFNDHAAGINRQIINGDAWGPGMCNTFDSQTNKYYTWPCASNFRVQEQYNRFVSEQCNTPEPETELFEGIFSIGTHYTLIDEGNNVRTFEDGLEWAKETFLHELVHTQDKADNRIYHHKIGNTFFHYGQDQTHYSVEIVPNIAFSYMEGIANSLSFVYNNSSRTDFYNWWKGNGEAYVEANPNSTLSGPNRFSRECLNQVYIYLSPAPENWATNILTGMGVSPTSSFSQNYAPGATTNYNVYKLRSLPPRFLARSEMIISLICSYYAQHVGPWQYLRALEENNETLFSANGSNIALLFRGLSNIAAVQNQNLKYLPFAYVDYFTYYSCNNSEEFMQFFENDNSVAQLVREYYSSIRPALKRQFQFTNPDDASESDLYEMKRYLLGQGEINSSGKPSGSSDSGLTLAFYPGYLNENSSEWNSNKQREFLRGAQLMGVKFGAIGSHNSNTQLLTGPSAAMPAVSVEDLISGISRTVNIVRSNGSGNEKVQTLAIFTHGVVRQTQSIQSYLNLGNGNLVGSSTDIPNVDNNYETIADFAAAIDPYLADDAKVVLYACLLGSTYPDILIGKDSNPKVRRDHETGGEGCFADLLRDELNKHGKNREVWGHRNTAHTYGNQRWRVFHGAQETSEIASEDLFGKVANIGGDQATQELVKLLKAQLIEKGVSTDNIESSSLRKWLGFIYPFVPEEYRPFVTRARGQDFEFKEGLVDWLANIYVEKNFRLREEVYPGSELPITN